MQKIREHFKSIDKKIAVTAPTGTAALNVGGQTLHSFAGCGVPTYCEDFGRCWGRIQKKNWESVEVLVIDEVGMVSAELIEWYITFEFFSVLTSLLLPVII